MQPRGNLKGTDMNILVTGANGQLGHELGNISSDSGNCFYFTDLDMAESPRGGSLDITDASAVREAVSGVRWGSRMDVIVNCAAYTDVDRAEEDYAAADIVNHKAVGNLAGAAAEYGTLLMHVSTDYVFGGDASVPYLEDSPVAPTGVYGVTKLDGERAVIESGCRHMIFRTAWLYSPYGKNFVKTIRRLVSEKDSINVVFDQVGTPTCAGDLAALIYMIIEKDMLDRTGIYHFSNEGVCSWYDFAIAIRDLSGYGQDGPAGHFCRISPCHSDEFPSKVKRPHYSVLDKTRVKSVFGVEIPHWMDSLKAVIEKMQYGSSQD